jgi:peptidoglycan-N-acetylglucosamine deacetylase
MKMYLRFSIFMCKITRTSPSYLLHPLDLIGKDHVPSLTFFPGMNIKSERKLKIFGIAIQILKDNFELLPMSKFSESLSGDLKKISLKSLKTAI